MKIALVELFVPSRRVADSASQLILRALRSAPQARNDAACAAIEAALHLSPDIVVCPGWTFVADDARSVGITPPTTATLVFETVRLSDVEAALQKSTKAEPAAAPLYPWTSWVWRPGQEPVELPRQVVSTGSEMDDDENAAALCAALVRRSVGDGALLLVCGEVNVVRLEKHGGSRRCLLTEGFQPLFEGQLVLNPVHTPNSSYMSKKRADGSGQWWRSLVTTGNTFDPALVRARGGTPAQTAWAYIDRLRAAPVKHGSGDWHKAQHDWRVYTVEAATTRRGR